MNKSELTPRGVFEQFARINEIPRPSKREEKMIAYLQKWGESHQLETVTDETGNVIIRKPATKGYENRETVVLQSHMDMVCDKLVDVDFDFDNDPIQTEVVTDEHGDAWLKAKGTTLGADDGIGCAIELALLDADDIEHGPIECVFTRDEETGLTGAEGMKSGFMTGKLLINLDSEDEGQVFVSCAGGRNTLATFRYQREELGKDWFFLTVSLKGLRGGHSGDDINKKRANAIKILSRFLYLTDERFDLRLASLDSGKLHNAIPRDGVAVFAIPEKHKEDVRSAWNIFTAEVEDEYHVTDTEMVFRMESADRCPVIEETVGRNMIRALQAVDNGVFAMCQDKDIDWLVETSSNLASVHTEEHTATVLSSQRSNVMSNLDNQAATVKALYQLAGAEVVQGDGYPAWKMKKDSALRDVVVSTYRTLFGHDPKVLGIHAGLECGLFSEKYPDMDMVSFGPTLRDVHTPQERCLVKTVQMVWDHLLLILKNIPEK